MRAFTPPVSPAPIIGRVGGDSGHARSARLRRRSALAALPLVLVVAVVSASRFHSTSPRPRTVDHGSAITTVYPVGSPRGVMATTGGWAYCEQMRALARRRHDTLLCGRFPAD